jgi:hypothetical protein
MEIVKVNVAKTDQGYCATVDILEAMIVAVDGNFAELQKELQESIEFYIKCAKKDGDEYPAVFDGEYEFHFAFDMESLLYCYEGIFSRASLSRITGINEKQLSHYANGRSKPRVKQYNKIVEGLHTLGKELLCVSV